MFVIIKKQKHMEKTDSSPLSRQALYADKKQWNQFLSIFLLAVGVGFTVAGIIFFFAYNWEELPKFAKLGIVEVLLVASVLLATFTHWNKLVKQILLTGATFLIGTLFAVFGQIYQTGADAYDLFLGWTLFTILWAVAIRFAPLWLTFIGLLCTTIWLYNIQIASANSWEMTLLANAVTWICALTTIITEWMSVKGHLDRNNRWFVSLLSLATIIHTSFLLMMAICEENAILSVPLISTLLLFSAGLWYGWKVKSLFYLAIIPFAALMILLTTFISQSGLRDVQIFFYGGVIVITGTTLLIYIILHLKKQWYDTEAQPHHSSRIYYRRNPDGYFLSGISGTCQNPPLRYFLPDCRKYINSHYPNNQPHGDPVFSGCNEHHFIHSRVCIDWFWYKCQH